VVTVGFTTNTYVSKNDVEYLSTNVMFVILHGFVANDNPPVKSAPSNAADDGTSASRSKVKAAPKKASTIPKLKATGKGTASGSGSRSQVKT
jgi:hypothetical protein